MKTIILLLLSFTAMAQSPCKDSTYVALQGTPIDSMTTRQYHYYAQKDKECSEFKKEEAQKKSTNKVVGIVIVISLISTVIIMLPVLML